MNNLDNYQKYFVVLQVRNKKGIAIWGADTKNENQDKFLIDKNQRILLFNTEYEAAQFGLNNSKLLFDKKNTLEWLKHGDNNLHANDLINIDILQEFSGNKNSTLSKEFANELIDSMNIIKDYALQTQNDKLLNFLNLETVRWFMDFLYNNYFWEKSMIFTENKFRESKLIVYQIYSEFINWLEFKEKTQ